jgi:formate--tetrahydrofolate ligase
MKSALEIAQEADLRPIGDVAAAAGIEPDEIEPYGRYRAKISLSILERLRDRPDGKLIITTAITPTKAGEGKTTTSISLTQGLGRLGRNVILCLREPSMGPVFGIKGGGTGGGYALIVPMEDINLHFNGDFHAVTAAHNLLASALDASLYFGNPLGIDPQTVTWPRALDVNARELRNAVIGLGGKVHGVPRESQFVITAASEIMAILALAEDLTDLRARLGRVVVASTYDGAPVTAEELKAAGAMAVIMKDALKPNLVQTLEGQPTLVHAGPFGNIAHANNSIIEDRVALKLADYVVTEAGFASDLGFQKFCDIVCRFGGFTPSAQVLVTTVRALKSHGGVAFESLDEPDLDAVTRGSENLAAHVEIAKAYGLPCVVAVNKFPSDTREELDLVAELAGRAGAETVVENQGFERGGEGAVELAQAVVAAAEKPNAFSLLTPEGASIREQVEAIATRLYGADGVDYAPQADKDIARMEQLGFGTYPVCMAKTHLSLSHDPTWINRPRGYRLPVRGVVPSAGAGFVVVLCGDMQRMPGLGRTPAFTKVDLAEDGRTVGLFCRIGRARSDASVEERDRLDLDQLATVAERRHADERARRGADRRGPDDLPHRRLRLVARPGHVDGRLRDVRGTGAPGAERGEQVLDHALGLRQGVVLADQVALGIERDGAGREHHRPATSHGDVGVAGRGRQRADGAELHRHRVNPPSAPGPRRGSTRRG